MAAIFWLLAGECLGNEQRCYGAGRVTDAPLRKNFDFRELRDEKLEPVAAVSDPPTEIASGNGRSKGPPERESEISENPKSCEGCPENFLLHSFILGLQDAVATFESQNFHPRYNWNMSKIAQHGGPPPGHSLSSSWNEMLCPWQNRLG